MPSCGVPGCLTCDSEPIEEDVFNCGVPGCCGNPEPVVEEIYTPVNVRLATEEDADNWQCCPKGPQDGSLCIVCLAEEILLKAQKKAKMAVA